MALTEEQLRAFVPRNYFLKEPYNVTVPEGEEEATTSYGIPNTDAFTNSGGGGGIGGNAFGYGTAIDPIAHGAYGEPGYSGGLAGNVQQTGWGRQTDPNYEKFGAGYVRPRKELPGIASMALGVLPFGNLLRRKIEDKMNPVYDPNATLGGYKMGGLDATGKGLYNTLAGQGMLFEGSTGLKTATGKNFMAKGYVEGQKEILDGIIDKYGSIQNAKDYFASNPKTTNFLKTQLNEALSVTDKLEEQEKYDKKVADRIKTQRIQNLKTQGKKDIHHGPTGGDDTTTITTTDQNQTGDGGGIDLNPSTDRDRGRSRKEGETGQIAGGHHFRSGGRVYLNLGGLASMLGREGLAPGGPAGGASAGGDYGGNVNPEQEYAGSTFEERHGGGDNQNNTVVVPKTNYIDVKPELLRENPYVDFSVMSPLEKLKLQATIGYRDIFDNDDLYAKGDLTTKLGPVTTKTQFTDDGIGNTDINWNNFSTTIDPNKNVQNIGYNNSYNGINYGVNYADGNTMFNVGTTFKHGGLARLL